MKKSIKIVVSILVLLIVSITVGIYVYQINHDVNSPKFNVIVGCWDGRDEVYNICKVENKKDIKVNISNCVTSFESELTLEQLAAQNDDFLQQIILYRPTGVELTGNLYFHDNNYYVIYINPANQYVDEFYFAKCLKGTISPNTEIINTYVPLPMELNLSDDILKMAKEEFGRDYIEFFFSKFTFDDLCEFYGRYTNGTAEIDYENKLIYVDAREQSADAEGLLEKYLCIDYNDKKFICDKGGEHEKIFE